MHGFPKRTKTASLKKNSDFCLSALNKKMSNLSLSGPCCKMPITQWNQSKWFFSSCFNMSTKFQITLTACYWYVTFKLNDKINPLQVLDSKLYWRIAPGCLEAEFLKPTIRCFHPVGLYDLSGNTWQLMYCLAFVCQGCRAVITNGAKYWTTLLIEETHKR